MTKIHIQIFFNDIVDKWRKGLMMSHTRTYWFNNLVKHWKLDNFSVKYLKQGNIQKLISENLNKIPKKNNNNNNNLKTLKNQRNQKFKLLNFEHIN